jgi:hypothetical protein
MMTLLNSALSRQLHRSLILVSILFLSACSTHLYVAEENWPSDMPPKRIFIQSYEADASNNTIQTEDEYMLWIVRFYKGWELYRRGWLKMTDELLEQLPNPDETEEVKDKIYHMGIAISAEWAKKSATRTIYLRHVYVWGNALLESIERNDCLNLINKINQDIDDLLEHRIEKDTITAERYYPVDPDNPFL